MRKYLKKRSEGMSSFEAFIKNNKLVLVFKIIKFGISTLVKGVSDTAEKIGFLQTILCFLICLTEHDFFSHHSN